MNITRLSQGGGEVEGKITILDPVFPQLGLVGHRLLVPIVVAVEGGVEAGTAEVPHVAYLVPLQPTGVGLPDVAGDGLRPILVLPKLEG